MKKKLRIGIVGYGNLGKSVELAVNQNPDIHLVAVFTKRLPSTLGSRLKVVSFSQIEDYKGQIDVLILCGSSTADLPEQGLHLAKIFNTIDSFDTHARIPEYFNKINETAKSNKTLCLISAGWDPGLFSLMRLLGESILPVGESYTFWGKGVSQGHSNAIRRVPGVKNGIQYTVPVENALGRVRAGENPKLTQSEKHIRICYVVAEEGADLLKIENSIKTMPNYFNEYKTSVNFITEEEFEKDHSGMPHAGIVIRSGITGEGKKQKLELNLNLESNPEFTASVMLAFARAVGRMADEGKTGALTVFDVPFAYLSPNPSEDIIKNLL